MFTQWFSDLDKALQGTVKTKTEERAPKERRAGSGGKGSEGRAMQPADDAWVADLVGTVARTIAEKTNSRMDAAEQRLTDLEAKQNAAAGVQKTVETQGNQLSNVQVLISSADGAAKKAAADVTALRLEVDELKKKLNERPTPAEPARPSDGGGPAPSKVDPRHARIGNLGFDSPPEAFEQKAKDFLAALGFPPERYQHLTAKVGKKGGSAAELLFQDPVDVGIANLAAQSSKIQGLTGKVIWIDNKKPFEDLRPTRVLHRLHEAATEIEKKLQSTSTLSLRTGAGEIRLGDAVLFFTNGSRVKTTSLARSRYTTEDIDFLVDFAEATR